MKERPILFSGPMVRALLDGTKTQTRRIVNPAPWEVLPPLPGEPGWPYGFKLYKGSTSHGEPFAMKCPYGQLGDRLWVRETFCECLMRDKIFYAASDPRPRVFSAGFLGHGVNPPCMNWTPSIFMRRKASRITLEIVGVRVARLKEISEADAKAEGIFLNNRASYHWRDGEDLNALFPSTAYRALWESINGADSWAINPWVWAITFKRIP